jgi:hypothetical protein
VLYIAAHVGTNYRFSKTELLMGIYFKRTSINSYFDSFITTSNCLGSSELLPFFIVLEILLRSAYEFYVRVTAYRNKFLCNNTN